LVVSLLMMNPGWFRGPVAALSVALIWLGTFTSVALAEVTSPAFSWQHWMATEASRMPTLSLGLPFAFQVGISLGLVAAILLIAKLYPNARRLVMLISFLALTRQIVWRVFETLTFEPSLKCILGWVIFAAELLSYGSMITGYFQLIAQTERPSEPLTQFPPEQWPTVDVMVCTYNEPEDVIYRTLIGCLGIDYPKKQVYLLDDGRRTEMKALADRLGARYITRTSNEHAKAGNLNHAMGLTSGELVVVFDADHVPCQSFLKEVVGFFIQRPKLAFVQTPQHFFTPDPFQRNLWAEDTINNEQDLFSHVIQAGNDLWGTTFFSGSGAIFHRNALASIGGFAVETITEDIHTGMRLHSAGWESFYYNKDLSAGLAQDSFGDFINQRVRWARGATQMFRVDNPILRPGLSLAQRWCYFSGVYYFFHGFHRMIFLVAPLLYMLFGIQTIQAGFAEILTFYLPGFLCLMFGYTLISYRLRQNCWSEVYETAQCLYLFGITTWTLFSPKRAKFKVTPKGTLIDGTRFDWHVVWPQATIGLLTLFGLGVSIWRAVIHPEMAGGLATNLIWGVYNLLLIAATVCVTRERPQRRRMPRIAQQFPVELLLGATGQSLRGTTLNLSESGAAIAVAEPIPVSGRIRVRLTDWEQGLTSHLSLEVIHCQLQPERNQFILAGRWMDLTDSARAALVQHLFGRPDFWNQDHRRTSTTRCIWTFISTPWRVMSSKEKAADHRRFYRFPAGQLVAITLPSGVINGQALELSEGGGRIRINGVFNLSPGDAVTLGIQWANGQWTPMSGRILALKSAKDGLEVRLAWQEAQEARRQAFLSQLFPVLSSLPRLPQTPVETSPLTAQRLSR
jgi:cellulose synthase (UDP-forming)